jgi:hypothetical protein
MTPVNRFTHLTGRILHTTDERVHDTLFSVALLVSTHCQQWRRLTVEQLAGGSEGMRPFIGR